MKQTEKKTALSSATKGFRGNLAVVLLFCGIAALVVSCDKPKGVVGEFHALSGSEWPYGTTLVFNEKGDTIADAQRNVEIIVQHGAEYEYANLWVELAYQTADTTARDTFNIVLADEYGKWFGTGSGPVRILADTLELRSLPLPNSSFALRHVMRVESLKGIEQIGILYASDEND